MHLTVIGASKGIGAATTRYALERGHTVNTLSRSQPGFGPDVDLEKVNVTLGDAQDPGALQAALEGSQAVIYALGVPKSHLVFWNTTFFSDTTRALLDAMQAHGPKRLILVTGFGAGDSYGSLSFIERLGFDVLLGRLYADKRIQEELVRSSGLDWTIARPGLLTNGAMSTKYQVLVEPNSWRQGIISRADVGHFLVHAAEDDSYHSQTPALQR